MHRHFLFLSALIAAAAAAQEAPAIVPDKNLYDGDYLIVGAGVALAPNYEGSSDQDILPVLGIKGRVHGIGINPRAAGVALDLLHTREDARIAFSLGPVLRYRANRTGRLKDPVVNLVGKLHGIIEGGVATGVDIRRVFNAHDTVSVGTDVRWDISGHGGGTIYAPGISYFTPLSRAQVAGVQVSADFVDGRYADYNYSVSPAGSAASGLPVYKAHGGLKDYGVAAFTARDLNGDFLDGGFAVAVGVAWTRLTGSAAETPMTAIRGTSTQWVAGIGLGYAF